MILESLEYANISLYFDQIWPNDVWMELIYSKCDYVSDKSLGMVRVLTQRARLFLYIYLISMFFSSFGAVVYMGFQHGAYPCYIYRVTALRYPGIELASSSPCRACLR